MGLSTYSVDTDSLYYMVPGSGNYVGNYPNSPYTVAPGYLVGAGAGFIGAAAPGSSSTRVVRDMGKTVFAAVSAAGNGTDLANAAPGYFRAVQILNPVPAFTPTQGTTASTNFGVNGSAPGSIPAGNAGDMGYNTFYVPIVVDGRLPGSSAGVVAGTTSAPLLSAQ
jgi:hypothetical protein